MAQTIQPQSVQQVAAPQDFAPPTGRQLRAEGVHRLQVGLLGLSAMLLLVGLASIIKDRVQLVEKANGTGAPVAEAVTVATSDPLADIGVVPYADPSVSASANGKAP